MRDKDYSTVTPVDDPSLQDEVAKQFKYRTPLVQALLAAGLRLDVDGLKVTTADETLAFVHSDITATGGARARRVAEKVEEMALAELLGRGRVSWQPWNDALTPEKNLLILAEQLRKGMFYGPYALVMGTKRRQLIDYDAAGREGLEPVTVRSQLENLAGIKVVIDHVQTDKTILFQLTADVVRVIVGLECKAYVFPDQTKHKVATIAVLQCRNNGIVVSD